MGLIKFKHAVNNDPTFFDDFFSRDAFRHSDSFVKKNIPVNIKETDAAFTIEVIAPGLKKENFNVELEQQTLVISYEAETNEEAENVGYIRKEYAFNTFKRYFTLNEKAVEVEKIDAKYENGILNVILPKKEKEVIKPSTKVKIK